MSARGETTDDGGTGSGPPWAVPTAAILAAVGILVVTNGVPARAEAAAGATGPVPRIHPYKPVDPAKPRRPADPLKGHTRIATLRGNAPRYASPGKRAKGTVPARWFGRPSVLPVTTTKADWVKVRLAQRPNGSTAWLRRADVTLGRTPYRIVIDLSSTHLYLYRNGRRIMAAAAGVGARDDPTPRGTFFVAFRQRPPRPNPGYGRFILVTSAHSPKIADWAGSGDAVIGIHGPLGEKRAIGKNGARISHGCIRLYDKSLNRLGSVPAGTPIRIRK